MNVLVLDQFLFFVLFQGTGCCSQFSITFHHLNPQTMLFMHHMLYRTSVYGRKTPTDINDMFSRAKVLPVDV